MVVLKARLFDIDFDKSEVVLHCDDAAELGVRPGNRIHLTYGGKTVTGIVNTTGRFINPGEIGVFDEIQKDLKVRNDSRVKVKFVPKPESIRFIRKKLCGGALVKEEIDSIVKDIAAENLSGIEVSAFVSALEVKDMMMNEIEHLTRAMVSTGRLLRIGKKPIFLKHSIGGVPGNKVTPIIVPIVAAAGLTIPKTSSRAITSPAGTADMLETIMPVSLTLEEIKEVVEKTNACMVWGGAVDLAPVDDILIHVEYPLDLDPHPLLLASVMSKQFSVRGDYLAIDIPMGKGAKAPTINFAQKLARDYIELGARLGIKTHCAITYGGQPVGYAVGPALEAIEALSVLRGAKSPNSLIQKSCALAGILLEMANLAHKNRGIELAKEILESGRAYEKFKEIVEAQGGNPNIKPSDLRIGKRKTVIKASRDGYVAEVSNHDIKMIGRLAGAPKDKGAGLVLHAKVATKVKKGDSLITIFSEKSKKLQLAEEYARSHKPVRIEGMMIEKVDHVIEA